MVYLSVVSSLYCHLNGAMETHGAVNGKDTLVSSLVANDGLSENDAATGATDVVRCPVIEMFFVVVDRTRWSAYTLIRLTATDNAALANHRRKACMEVLGSLELPAEVVRSAQGALQDASAAPTEAARSSMQVLLEYKASESPSKKCECGHFEGAACLTLGGMRSLGIDLKGGTVEVNHDTVKKKARKAGADETSDDKSEQRETSDEESSGQLGVGATGAAVASQEQQLHQAPPLFPSLGNVYPRR